MKTNRVRIMFSALAGLVVGWSGCVKSGDNPSADKGNVMHIANGTEPADLDPQTVTGRPESNIIRTLIEGLVIPDAETLVPKPGQAESWEISADGLVYTFKLRPEAKWSNGDPVTAQDFVGSWRRILTPSLGAEYAYNLFMVVGAEAYAKGTLTDFDQTGFKVLDARTIQITLRNPTSYLLNLMTHYSWHPVHLPTVEKFGGLERKGSRWTRPENYVGNGPFVLTEWKPNQHILVTRSPTYWGADAVRLDGVRFYPIENTDAAERMFRTGQLDATNALPLNKIDTYRETGRDVLRVDPYLATGYFRLNVEKPQLADPRVRRAIALSIDRVGLAEKVFRGTKFAHYSFSPSMPGFTPPETFHDNLEEARALLAEAGYPGGKGLPPVEILYPSSDSGRVVCEALQAMISAALGIEVRLYNQEWKVYLDSMVNRNFDIAWSAWIGDYVDPMTFLDMMVTDGGNNRTGWSSLRYDELVQLAQAEPDPVRRNGHFSEMEAILGAEVPVIPLYSYTNVYLLSPGVKGWYPTLLDIHPFQDVWLER
jgi:oligopeptide transport system substrate-binding protein